MYILKIYSKIIFEKTENELKNRTFLLEDIVLTMAYV